MYKGEGLQTLFNKEQVESFLTTVCSIPVDKKQQKREKKSLSVSGGGDLLLPPDWMKLELFAFADCHKRRRRSADCKISVKVMNENSD